MPGKHPIEYYSYKDYVLWEGNWELIDGLPLAMTPSPNILHQALAGNILFELKKSIGDCRECLVLAEEDWKISEHTVVRADVVLICNEPSDQHITKTPEIVVEVVSATSVRRDEITKFEIYAEERVPYYVIVYPEDLNATLYKLQDGGYAKEGEYSVETYAFANTTCGASIDFDQVFKQFR